MLPDTERVMSMWCIMKRGSSWLWYGKHARLSAMNSNMLTSVFCRKNKWRGNYVEHLLLFSTTRWASVSVQPAVPPTLGLRSIWGFTHSTVIEQLQQRDEESSPMLPVPPDHTEEVRAERRVGFVLPETSNDGPTRGIDGLLQTVRHLHPRNSLHLYNLKNKHTNYKIFLAL